MTAGDDHPDLTLDLPPRGATRFERAVDADIVPDLPWVTVEAALSASIPSTVQPGVEHFEPGAGEDPPKRRRRRRVPRPERGQHPLLGDLLDSKAVAAHLGIAPNTVILIPATELPFVQVGRGKQRIRRRYRVADVEAYVAGLAERSKTTVFEQEPATASRKEPKQKKSPASGPSRSALTSAWLKMKDR